MDVNASLTLEEERMKAVEGLKAKAFIRGVLESTLRVTLSDGRIVSGRCQCMDEHLNFILQCATERRKVQERSGIDLVEKQQTRHLGMVMLPGKHVVKIEFQTSVPDRLEINRST